MQLSMFLLSLTSFTALLTVGLASSVPRFGVCGTTCKAFLDRKSYVDKTLSKLGKDVEYLYKYVDSKPLPPPSGCPPGYKYRSDWRGCYKVDSEPKSWISDVCGITCKAFLERKSYIDDTLSQLRKDVEYLKKYIGSRPTSKYIGSRPTPSQCPHGFKSLHDRHVCYKVVTVPMTWYQGQTYCASLTRGAHLAYITSRQQNDALTDHLLDYKGTSQCYIAGASHEIFFTSGQRVKVGDCRSDFHWKLDDWTTIPMTYRNWKSGEPNCYGGLKEGCVNIRCNGRRCEWNDYSCDLKSCLICQVHLG